MNNIDRVRLYVVNVVTLICIIYGINAFWGWVIERRASPVTKRAFNEKAWLRDSIDQIEYGRAVARRLTIKEWNKMERRAK